MLVLLLVNFIVSQQLSTSRENLAVDVDQSREVVGRLQHLQQAATQQQNFLTATGWAQPSWNSLCADRLAASVPAGVQLLALEISPSQATSGASASQRLTFRKDLVLVKGQCRDAQRLNLWLQKLSALQWVRAVRDQNFAYDFASGVGTFTFALEVNPAILFP
ncbi:MAG TPA: hypothetical protein VF690_03840 [Hymenobacter sp.]